MPSDVFTFASGATTMRYRQPFTTEGLNQKNFAVQPPGCYRGLRLAVDGGAGERTVNIKVDAETLDHLAVVNTSSGFALTVRKIGDILVSLSTLSSVSAVISLFASYSVGATTAALIRVHTVAEYDALSAAAREELVVLGTVAVPVSGVIGLADITHDRRTPAGFAIPAEAMPWSPLIRNGHFEWADDTVVAAVSPDNNTLYLAEHWLMVTDSGDAVWQPSTGDPNTPPRHLDLTFLSTGVTEVSLSQSIQIPVTPGELIRVRFFKKAIQIASAGTFKAQLTYLTAVPGIVLGRSIDIDMTGTDGSYVEIDVYDEVPATAVRLAGIAFSTADLNVGSTGSALLIDDVQVWAESSPLFPERFLNLRPNFPSIGDSLFFGGLTPDGPGQVIITGQDGSLRLQRRDLQEDGAIEGGINLILRGQLIDIGDQLLTGTDPESPRYRSRYADPAVLEYTEMHEWRDFIGGTRNHIRLFASGVVADREGFVVTINARFRASDSMWATDNNNEDSYKLSLTSAGGFEIEYHEGVGGGVFADDAWDATLLSASRAEVGAGPDRSIHLGVGPVPATRYLRRFGRMHEGWFHFRDDFTGRDITNNANSGAQWDFAGDGGGIAPQIANQSLTGILSMPTGTTINGTSWIHTYDRHTKLLDGVVFECIIETPANIAAVEIEVGCSDAAAQLQLGANFNDACFVRFNTGSDSNWVLVGVDGFNTVITEDASGTAVVAGTRYRLTVECHPDGSAELYVNGVEEATIPAGSVGDGAQEITYFKARHQTLDTTAKTLQVDRMEIWQDPLI